MSQFDWYKELDDKHKVIKDYKRFKKSEAGTITILDTMQSGEHYPVAICVP